MTTLTVPTGETTEFVDLTARVEAVVSQSGLMDGLCTVYVPHTTAGVTINENADPDVRRDLGVAFAEVVCDRGRFRHSEGNSPAHVKASLVGASVSIPVVEGRLALGTWQGIYFCEFDGPRTRKVHVVLTPGAGR